MFATYGNPLSRTLSSEVKKHCQVARRRGNAILSFQIGGLGLSIKSTASKNEGIRNLRAGLIEAFRILAKYGSTTRHGRWHFYRTGQRTD